MLTIGCFVTTWSSHCTLFENGLEYKVCVILRRFFNRKEAAILLLLLLSDQSMHNANENIFKKKQVLPV